MTTTTPTPTRTTTNPTILLLKSLSVPEDKYAALFSSKGYTPVFLPVLDHNFHTHNLSTVRSLLAAGELTPGPQRKYGGLIFTSQRAVEGFGRVLRELHDTQTPIPIPDPDPTHSGGDNPPAYLPLYAVGPATSSALSSLRDRFLPPPVYNAEVLGAESGNGEVLARFILKHYNSLPRAYTRTHSTQKNHDGDDEGGDDDNEKEEEEQGKLPLLFLTGEQHRDVIPKTLMNEDSLPASERIPVRELVVYEAGIKPGLEVEMGRTLRSLSLLPSSDSSGSGSAGWTVLWIVLFSPGSSHAVLSSLRLAGLRGGPGGAGDPGKVFIATIGSTTRDHLRNHFGVEADVCAERPSPEGLYAGIQAVMERLDI